MDEKNTNKIFFDLPKNKSCAIKVIGVGGGGNNAVSYMYNQGIIGVDFIICNTDAQALNNHSIPTKIQLGSTITEGLGAGSNPEIGEQAALESFEDIKTVLGEHTKMVFITAGMGGGTGTGAAPIIANIAKELGILTVAIVTMPFSFEGRLRVDQAEKGVENIRKNVDSLIVIRNDKLRELYGNLGYKSGFSKSNEVLSTAAKGIAEVITKNYSINIDLRDAKTVLQNSGTAIMGSAIASGENRAQEAIKLALDSPLLNDNKITGSKNVLLLIISGEDEITVDEIGIINDHIQNEAGNNTNIIMGIGEDLSLKEHVRVTVIATGFPVDDERNNGKQKIYHSLEEENKVGLFDQLSIIDNDQKINSKSVQELSVPNNKKASNTKKNSTHSKKIVVLEDIEEQTDFGISCQSNNKYKDLAGAKSNNPVRYLVDSHKEEINLIKRNSEIKQETAIENKIAVNTFAINNEEQPDNDQIELKNISFSKKMFSIDQTNPFSNQAAQNITSNSIAEAGNKKPMKQDIVRSDSRFTQKSQNISQKELDFKTNEDMIKERRERLKMLNDSFQSLSRRNVDEVERVPAYLRKGVQLDDAIQNDQGSDLFFNAEKEKIIFRPNNFLHDNVD